MITNKSADFSCSLYKLQLKFVQTTRVVCTDFAEVCRIGSAISIQVTLYNSSYYIPTLKNTKGCRY